MAAGCRPHAIQSLASAYSKMNSAGWVSRVGVAAGRRRGRAIELRRSAPTMGSAIGDAVDRSARGRRHAPRRARRAIPGYCAPWPGNMKTSGGLSLRRARSSPASARKASIACSRDGAGDGGAMPEGAPAGLKGEGDIVEGDIGTRRRVRRRARSPRREAPRRCGPTAAARGGVAPPGGRARSAGASSSTTCTLVPPTPNELTPARRGPSPADQAGAASGHRTGCRRRRCVGWAGGSWPAAGFRGAAAPARP